jgi:hypothetical protein
MEEEDANLLSPGVYAVQLSPRTRPDFLNAEARHASIAPIIPCRLFRWDFKGRFSARTLFSVISGQSLSCPSEAAKWWGTSERLLRKRKDEACGDTLLSEQKGETASETTRRPRSDISFVTARSEATKRSRISTRWGEERLLRKREYDLAMTKKGSLRAERSSLVFPQGERGDCFAKRKSEARNDS